MARNTLYSILILLLSISVSFIYLLKDAFLWRYEVLGFSRPPSTIRNVHGTHLTTIPNTNGCEDIHYHAASNLIFGVAETDPRSRSNWFPGTANYADPHNLSTGQIFTIDPSTTEKTVLELENFSGPFVTHGIDIYTPPSEPEAVYILAINHLPNPAHLAGIKDAAVDIPAARSQVELFKYTIGNSSTTHLRSVTHPLIRTPNDIYAVNEHEIYVTNDHYYRGGLMRQIEEFGGHEFAGWSDVVYVHWASLDASSGTEGVDAKVALRETHNPNGLGHGPNGEVVLGRAVAGMMAILRPRDDKTLEITEQVRLKTTVDNPFYFEDPYVRESGGRNASGYVLACLTRAMGFPKDESQPVSVWLVQRTAKAEGGGRDGMLEGEGRDEKGKKGWEHHLIFQDDGRVIHTASTAVLVAIDPRENEGRKEGWLFVAGPLAENVIRTKIEL